MKYLFHLILPPFVTKDISKGKKKLFTKTNKKENEYRQISGFLQDSKAEGKEPVIGVGSLIESKEDFDAEALALEAFSLINEARAENGLHKVELNEEAMELARMRAPELEEQYSHIRPDGSRMSRTYRCGEIILSGARD